MLVSSVCPFGRSMLSIFGSSRATRRKERKQEGTVSHIWNFLFLSHPFAVVAFLTFDSVNFGECLRLGIYIERAEGKMDSKTRFTGRERDEGGGGGGGKGNKNSLSAPRACPLLSVTAGYFFLWQSDKRRIFIPRVRAYLR